MFCNSCGQKNESSRLSTGEIAGGILEHIAELDMAIVRTVWGLTVNPGRVCREFVAGYRKRYTNPMKYCFLCAALLLAVRAWLGAKVIEMNVQVAGEEGDAATVFAADLTHQVTALVEHNLNWFRFLAVPVVALMLWRVVRRERNTYAEHLSFALYVFGHSFLLGVVAILLARFFPSWLAKIAGYSMLPYLCWGVWGMYGRSIWWSILCTVAMLITYVLAIVFYAGVFSLIVLVVRLVLG